MVTPIIAALMIAALTVVAPWPAGIRRLNEPWRFGSTATMSSLCQCWLNWRSKAMCRRAFCQGGPKLPILVPLRSGNRWRPPNGVVTLISSPRRNADAWPSSCLGGGIPSVECLEAVISDCQGGAATSGGAEAISDGCVGGHKPLQPAWRPRPSHRSFPLSERQMAVPGTVVEALVRPMVQTRAISCLAAP